MKGYVKQKMQKHVSVTWKPQFCAKNMYSVKVREGMDHFREEIREAIVSAIHEFIVASIQSMLMYVALEVVSVKQDIQW